MATAKFFNEQYGNLFFFLHAAILCTIEPLINGSVKYSEYGGEIVEERVTYGTVVMYNCNSGFALVGDKNRTCQIGLNNTGSWSGSSPHCEGNVMYH